MTKEMTSRERVYTTVNFQEPDRVPIDFGGTGNTSITECPPSGRVCSQLYEYLGISDTQPVEISDIFSVVANLDERLLRRLHSDFRNVSSSFPGVHIEPDGSKTWPAFCGLRIRKTGYYDNPCDFPLRNMVSEKEIDE